MRKGYKSTVEKEDVINNLHGRCHAEDDGVPRSKLTAMSARTSQGFLRHVFAAV